MTNEEDKPYLPKQHRAGNQKWRDKWSGKLLAVKKFKAENPDAVNEYERRLVAITNEQKADIDELPIAFSTQCVYYAGSNTMVNELLGSAARSITRTILMTDRTKKKAHMAQCRDKNMAALQGRAVTLRKTDYFAILDALKRSDNYYDMISCCIMATGRRPTEITRTGEFTAVSSETISQPALIPAKSAVAAKLGTATPRVHVVDTKQMVWFKGQLKRRGPNDGDEPEVREDECVLMPVLGMSPGELIAKMAELRARHDFSNKCNREAIEVTATGICRALRRAFALHYGCSMTCLQVRKISAHILRGCYAYIAYRMYGDPADAETWWSARVLGHRHGDLSCFSEYYNKAYVDMGSPPLEEMPKIREEDDDCEPGDEPDAEEPDCAPPPPAPETKKVRPKQVVTAPLVCPASLDELPTSPPVLRRTKNLPMGRSPKARRAK